MGSWEVRGTRPGRGPLGALRFGMKHHSNLTGLARSETIRLWESVQGHHRLTDLLEGSGNGIERFEDTSPPALFRDMASVLVIFKPGVRISVHAGITKGMVEEQVITFPKFVIFNPPNMVIIMFTPVDVIESFAVFEVGGGGFVELHGCFLFSVGVITV